MKIKLLVDADMLIFQSCIACERDVMWTDDVCTVDTNVYDAYNKLVDKMAAYENIVYNRLMEERDDDEDIEFETVMCLSSHCNFRKVVNPDYKANRVGKRKPCGYKRVKEMVKENFVSIEIPWLEADDVIGINAGDNTVIISGDKDMGTLPTTFYDFSRDTFTHTSLSAADHMFFKQVLMGDKVDGYDGLPHVGKVTADKILDKDCSWHGVVAAYEEKGVNETVAVKNARMARILRRGEYKEEDGKQWIKLWGNSKFVALPEVKE